ncbi:TetR/AcrR family transcriptional regulator [Streptomyces sp. SP18CS02]|uniref:TetR/AcrR family transcriptional regulator n=1 Tax=Streptomyces sp. SP18CS02 TaxID=3002531 RepID=UPI002E774A8D|nr:TetR/AcrR family transcriptional regulator [Streptomyces sp. SP18CS02]MEE1757332.1 TetR/AcrR family transcriptional regulator [Streptomyces sp. SP18CS02]
MPTAREALLDAASAALAGLPWSAVRMVDVASAAGLSRQTLYNEFGSKDGLARALVRREADAYLRGVEHILADRPHRTDPLVSVAEWTVSQAHGRPLLRALLTGCWGERLPAPRPARTPGAAPGPPRARAQRRADAGPPAPGELAAEVWERSRAALERGGAHGRSVQETCALAHRCELAVRLALSYVVAPGGEGVGVLVRTACGGPDVSGTSPRAGDR